MRCKSAYKSKPGADRKHDLWVPCVSSTELVPVSAKSRHSAKFRKRPILLSQLSHPPIITTMKSLFLASALATAAASAVLVTSPAQAACTTSVAGNNCALFNPTSPSNAVYSGYTDAGWATNDRLTDISFYSTSVTSGFPITLTDIAYSLDGTNFATTNLTSTSYTIAANGVPGSGTNLLTAFNIGSPIGTSFKLRFTIPSVVGFVPTDGSGSIGAFVRNQRSTGPVLPQTQTRDSSAFYSPTKTPSPLPLIGAGAAFGFSRKLRRRISMTA